MTETTGMRVEAYLQARGFKRKGDEWQGNSPFRAGADSNSFWVRIEADGEHGAFKDFSHNDGGSLYDFCERVGIPVNSARVDVQTTKRGYADLAEYAAAHFAPTEAFTAAGWAQITHHNRPALVIPTATGKRYRYIDGQKPPFAHEKGYKRCWYGLERATANARAAQTPIVLVNGEPSVVVGQWYGVPAAAVTSSGEKQLPPDALGELKARWEGQRIIVALDCDAAGRAASDTLAAQLMDAGFVVAVVDLGLGDKGDLCDFAGLHADGLTDALLTRAAFTAPTPQNAALQALKSLSPMMTALDAKLRHSRPSAPDVIEQLNQLSRQIEAIRHGLPTAAMVTGEEVADTLTHALAEAQANHGRINGLTMGFPDLDRITGGLKPGLNIVMGATGMGKSTLVASIAGFQMAASNRHGVVMSTEMHPEEWSLMAACYMAGVNSADAMDGTLNDKERARLMDAVNRIDCGLTFVHGASPTVATLAETIAQARTVRPVDYVIIDSASNLINGIGRDTREASHTVYDDLQALSMRVKLPFIVTHQLSGRAVAARDNKVGNIYDGYGSSAVENYARALFILYWHQYYVEQQLAQPDDRFPNGTAAIRIAKLRMRRNSASKLHLLDYLPGTGFYARTK